ncbi:MAG: toll/interleukin-1 receptor domain-containing protein [Alphaproteobacteria bacterium]|nr:toll/interleukin-1 receptor domain-containing protein [Alphaproteobacteria bacterium]
MSQSGAPSAPFRYRAFISYSHRDTAWADWLHKAVERYRVPRPLVGRRTAQGLVPARLVPLFRDREELAASTDLSAVITAALEGASHLVVLCSPRAARSKWVNEEILAFKRLGREDRIVAIIVDGEPNSGDPATECFPEALKFRIGPDGAPSAERTEPVAADARESGDGKDNAKLKLIAGLLGVGLDDLKRREAQAQRRRTAFAYSLTGVFALLAVAAVWFAVEATRQQTRAEAGEAEAVAQRDRANAAVDTARDTAERMTSDFTEKLRTAPGAQMAVLADILERSVLLMDDLGKSSPLGSEELYVQAMGLIGLSRADNLLGNLETAIASAERAIAILDGIKGKPDAPREAAHDAAAARQTLGDANLTLGRDDAALAAYEESRVALAALVAAEPAERRYKRSLGVAWQKIGEAQERRQGMAAARAAYEARLTIAEELDPGWPKDDAILRRDLPMALFILGDLLNRQDASAAARPYLERSVALFEGLAGDFPNDTGIAFNHAQALAALAAYHMAAGTAAGAEANLVRAIAILEQLYALDGGNQRWGQALYEAHANYAFVLRGEGRKEEALTHARRAVAVLDGLIAINGGVRRWQSDAAYIRSFIAEVEAAL